MARKNRGRIYQSRLARPQALDHTASRNRDRFESMDEDSSSDYRGWSPTPSVRPLIRTVLEIPSTPFKRPFGPSRKSPTLAVRATFRSSDKPTRSPFLNATTITPQLTERALHCASRNIRREVLFAKRKTGKGSSGPRKPQSKVKC